MKYVLRHWQKVQMSGVVYEAASSDYAGVYLQDNLTLPEDFIVFEHTDVLNMVSIAFQFNSSPYAV